jgi:tetratricopeptide (TPR) repeat protein
LLANAYNNLAGIYCAQGNFSDAELHNELSLGLKKRWQDQRNLGYLLSLSYHNMALVNARQGKFEDAAGYFEQALVISEPNESTVRRALTYHNYGSMRFAQGQITVALGLLETAFQLRWESLGDHYDTATSLHMLASCYQALGDEDSLKIAR